VREGLQDAITESDFMTRRTELERKRRVDSALDAITRDQRFAEYDMLRNTVLTPEDLQGRKGRDLQDRRTALLREYDPTGEAGLEATKLFELRPLQQRQQRSDFSMGLYAKKEEDAQRIKNVMLKETGVPISLEEARSILQDSRNVATYLKRAKFDDERIKQLLPVLGTQFNKELAAEAGRNTRTGMTIASREERDREKLAQQDKWRGDQQKLETEKTLIATLKGKNPAVGAISQSVESYVNAATAKGISNEVLKNELNRSLQNSGLNPNGFKIFLSQITGGKKLTLNEYLDEVLPEDNYLTPRKEQTSGETQIPKDPYGEEAQVEAPRPTGRPEIVVTDTPTNMVYDIPLVAVTKHGLPKTMTVGQIDNQISADFGRLQELKQEINRRFVASETQLQEQQKLENRLKFLRTVKRNI